MILSHLWVKNFRNFEELDLDLGNLNVIFGPNDIGKTNLLQAIRYLLDPQCRRMGFVDSDYYLKNTSNEIEIMLSIDISDEEDDNNKKIFAKTPILKTGQDILYIKLTAKYNYEHLFSDIKMFWGGDKEDLEEMVVSQQCRCDIDYIFNVIYIDSTLQLENVFKSYVKSLFQGQKNIQKAEKDNLQKCIKELNSVISNMKAMCDFQGELNKEYRKYRDEQLEIKIKSEVEMDNVYSKLVPYISNNEDNTYPTAGDGRKKIVEYSLLSMQSREIEKTKINIFLIEELENHLHRSLQIALSFRLFEDCLFKHMFITTHSSLVVSRMDNVNLIKLYMKSKPIGRSINYKVPIEYEKSKSKLNEGLSEAIFAEKVLLVEGPSEKILFERVMLDICPKYECTGKFILPVDGVSFKVYYDILTNLGIKCIVKTDNDLKYITDKNAIELSGINRCADIAKVSELPKWNLKNKRKKEEFDINRKIWQRNFYSYFSKIINQLSNKYIYLSHIDLENDLYDVIPSTMQKYVDLNKGKLHPIDYLQNAKQNRMVELCEVISSDDAKRIYNHEYFRCLKELLKND